MLNLFPLLIRFSTLDTPWGLRKHQKHVKFNQTIDKGKQKYTIAKEFVQSEGEKRIHNFLTKNNILFEYDQRLTLTVKGFLGRPKQQWVRPDFYLKQNNAVIEFWGYIRNKEYRKKMKKKREYYKQAGLALIELYPRDIKHLEITLTIKLKQLGIL